MDTARVVELYVPDFAGAAGRVGSGYRLTEQLVLTAAHVVAGPPTAAPEVSVPGSLDPPGACQARPLGQQGWTPAVVAWWDADADVAVLRLVNGKAVYLGVGPGRQGSGSR